MNDENDQVRVRCRKRGALVIEGNITLSGPDGEPIDLGDRKKIMLCRCGASKNRPFCDGSHYKTDFEADV